MGAQSARRTRPNGRPVPHGERRLAFGAGREALISISVALLALTFVIGVLLVV